MLSELFYLIGEGMSPHPVTPSPLPYPGFILLKKVRFFMLKGVDSRFFPIWICECQDLDEQS